MLRSWWLIAVGELLAGLGHTAFATVNRGAHWLGNHILHEDTALAAHLGGLQKNQ